MVLNKDIGVVFMKLIKAILRHVANQFGFQITRIPKNAGLQTTQAYEPVRPSATYSPWNKDSLFKEVYAGIQFIYIS
jgi:hypothetical protein